MKLKSLILLPIALISLCSCSNDSKVEKYTLKQNDQLIVYIGSVSSNQSYVFTWKETIGGKEYFTGTWNVSGTIQTLDGGPFADVEYTYQNDLLKLDMKDVTLKPKSYTFGGDFTFIVLPK